VRKLGLPTQLKSIGELRTLEKLAHVRSTWMNIVMCMTDSQVPEEVTQRCLRPRGDAKRQ
jgi:hypothetical protein